MIRPSQATKAVVFARTFAIQRRLQTAYSGQISHPPEAIRTFLTAKRRRFQAFHPLTISALCKGVVSAIIGRNRGQSAVLARHHARKRPVAPEDHQGRRTDHLQGLWSSSNRNNSPRCIAAGRYKRRQHLCQGLGRCTDAVREASSDQRSDSPHGDTGRKPGATDRGASHRCPTTRTCESVTGVAATVWLSAAG